MQARADERAESCTDTACQDQSSFALLRDQSRMQGRASESVVSRADSASDLRTADSLGKSVRGRAPLHRGFSEDFNAVTLEVEAGPRATGEALVSCGTPEAASAPSLGRAQRCPPSSHASRPQPSAFLHTILMSLLLTCLYF